MTEKTLCEKCGGEAVAMTEEPVAVHCKICHWVTKIKKVIEKLK
jgi:hypothetical protein